MLRKEHMATFKIKSKGLMNGSEGFVSQQNDDVDFGGDSEIQEIFDMMTKGGLVSTEDRTQKQAKVGK